MEHCKNGHREVYYEDKGSCPACELLKKIDRLERKLYDLNLYADNLRYIVTREEDDGR